MDENLMPVLECGINTNPDGTSTAYIGDTTFTGTDKQCREWLYGPPTIWETGEKDPWREPGVRPPKPLE